MSSRIRGRAGTALTARVIAAAGGVCYWCACPATTRDHWPEPLAHLDRDTTNPGAYVAACQPCNSARGKQPGPPRPCPTCGVVKHPRSMIRSGW